MLAVQRTDQILALRNFWSSDYFCSCVTECHHTSKSQESPSSSWYLALTASPAAVSGRGVPGKSTERLWSRNLYTLRGVRGGGRRVLVLRRGPLLARHRENDRSQAGNLLAGLLELHQPSLPLGERQLQRQAHANNVYCSVLAIDLLSMKSIVALHL